MNISEIQTQTGLGILFVVAAVGFAVVATLLKIGNNKLRNTLAELRDQKAAEQQQRSQEQMTAAIPIHTSEQPPPEAMPPAHPFAADPPAAAHPSALAPAAGHPSAVAPAALPPAAVAPAAVAPEIETIPTTQTSPSQEVEDVLKTTVRKDSEVRDSNTAIGPLEERATGLATGPKRRSHRPLPKRDENNPEALSEWLKRCAVARIPQKTAPAPKLQPTHEPAGAVAALTVAKPRQIAIPVEESVEALLVSEPPARHEIQETVPNLNMGLVHTPATVHRATLSRFLESKKPSNSGAAAGGLSLNDRRAVGQAVILQLDELVRKMLEEGDFAFRIKEDEVQVFCSAKRALKRNGD